MPSLYTIKSNIVNRILFFKSFAWLKAPAVFKFSLDIINYFWIIFTFPPAFVIFSSACLDAEFAEISIFNFKSLNKKNIAVLNLSKIQNIVDKSSNKIKDILDLKTLKEKKLINKKYLKLKILGTGEIKNKLEISAHFASKQALTKIEKVGGKLSLIKK